MEPTVEQDGYLRYSCDTCSYYYDEVIPRGEHDFVIQNTNPVYLAEPATCASPAKYYYTCECGAHGGNTFTDGDKKDHNFVLHAATDNKKASFECPTCGYTTEDCGDYSNIADNAFTGKQISDLILNSDLAFDCGNGMSYYVSKEGAMVAEMHGANDKLLVAQAGVYKEIGDFMLVYMTQLDANKEPVDAPSINVYRSAEHFDELYMYNYAALAASLDYAYDSDAEDYVGRMIFANTKPKLYEEGETPEPEDEFHGVEVHVEIENNEISNMSIVIEDNYTQTMTLIGNEFPSDYDVDELINLVDLTEVDGRIVINCDDGNEAPCEHAYEYFEDENGVGYLECAKCGKNTKAEPINCAGDDELTSKQVQSLLLNTPLSFEYLAHETGSEAGSSSYTQYVRTYKNMMIGEQYRNVDDSLANAHYYYVENVCKGYDYFEMFNGLSYESSQYTDDNIGGYVYGVETFWNNMSMVGVFLFPGSLEYEYDSDMGCYVGDYMNTFFVYVEVKDGEVVAVSIKVGYTLLCETVESEFGAEDFEEIAKKYYDVNVVGDEIVVSKNQEAVSTYEMTNESGEDNFEIPEEYLTFLSENYGVEGIQINECYIIDTEKNEMISISGPHDELYVEVDRENEYLDIEIESDYAYIRVDSERYDGVKYYESNCSYDFDDGSIYKDEAEYLYDGFEKFLVKCVKTDINNSDRTEDYISTKVYDLLNGDAYELEYKEYSPMNDAFFVSEKSGISYENVNGTKSTYSIYYKADGSVSYGTMRVVWLDDENNPTCVQKYTYDLDADDWVCIGVENRSIENGLYRTEILSLINGIWVPYNLIISSNNPDEPNVPFAKGQKTYHYETYNRDLSTGKWIGNEKRISAYDEDEGYEYEERYSWDGDAECWAGTSKYEIYYNDSHKRECINSYEWDAENNDWIIESEKEYLFDSDGSQIGYEETKYEDGAVSSKTKQIEIYESDGCSYVENYVWLFNEEKYIGTTKTEVIIDSDEGTRTTINWSWSTSENTWVCEEKSISYFEEDDYEKEKTFANEAYIWSDDLEDWVPNTREEWGLIDEDGHAYSANFVWSGTLGDWVCVNKTISWVDEDDVGYYEYYSWDDDVGALIGRNKNIHYESEDEFGVTHETSFSYSWDIENEEWYIKHKQEITKVGEYYDYYHYYLENEYSLSDENEWYLSRVEEEGLREDGKMVDIDIWYDAEYDSWSVDTYSISYYDDLGIEYTENYVWNDSSKCFEGSSANGFYYSEDGYMITVSVEWSDTLREFVKQNMVSEMYDSDGKIIRIEKSIYSIDTFVLREFEDYEYVNDSKDNFTVTTYTYSQEADALTEYSVVEYRTEMSPTELMPDRIKRVTTTSLWDDDANICVYNNKLVEYYEDNECFAPYMTEMYVYVSGAWSLAE